MSMENGSSINDLLAFIKNNALNSNAPLFHIEMIQWLHDEVGQFHTSRGEEFNVYDEAIEKLIEDYKLLQRVVLEGRDIVKMHIATTEESISEKWAAALLENESLGTLKKEIEFLSMLECRPSMLSIHFHIACVDNLEKTIESVKDDIQRINANFEVFQQL